MKIHFQVYSKPEELWFYILLLEIKYFLNFKDSDPQFFLDFFQNSQEFVRKLNEIKKNSSLRDLNPYSTEEKATVLSPTLSTLSQRKWSKNIFIKKILFWQVSERPD